MSVYLEVRRRAENGVHLIRAGFPSLWLLIGVIIVLVGGDVVLIAVWGIRHLAWGVAIVLGIIGFLLMEGSYRESRKIDHIWRSPRLLQVQQLAAEGQVIRARLPATQNRLFVSLPPGLIHDYKTWKEKATAGLEPWPDFQAHFQGETAGNLQWTPTQRICSEIEKRTEVLTK